MKAARHKTMYCRIPFIWNTQNIWTYRDKPNGACQGNGEDEMGTDCLKGMRISFGDEHVLELDKGDGCRTLNVLNATDLYTLK